MVGLHRRLLFGLLLSHLIPLTLADTHLVIWGRGSAASIPDATRVEIEAAGGIALLVGTGRNFARTIEYSTIWKLEPYYAKAYLGNKLFTLYIYI